MNSLVYHIVSGQSFFTGTALLLLAALLSLSSKHLYSRLAGLAFVLGILLVAISSTAIPYWYYGVTGIVSLVWVFCQLSTTYPSQATATFIVVWMIAVVLEIPYHVTPEPDPVSSRKIAVIGDSVTAGVGGNSGTETWPNIIARQHDLIVQDISHVGETAASALERIRKQPIDSPIVLIEIGGNDLLGSTTAEQFANDLDELLLLVSKPGRQILMFELPLPPFRHEYGRIQRQLSQKHGVLLIPKRIFLNVIAGSGSTLDTIHLSQAGHQRMAETVWSVIEAAYAK